MGDFLDEILTYEKSQQKKDVKSDVLEKLYNSAFDITKPPVDVDFILNAVIDTEHFGIGARGMLGVVSGVAKSRKTTFLGAIVASGLSGNVVVNMSLRPGGSILYFDTEQPDYFFYKTQRRAHLLAGVRENVSWYKAFALRDFMPDERVQAIDKALEKEKPAVIIVDGVLDLVNDMNDLKEAQAIAQQLMTWTKTYNCLCLIVLHRNESISGRGKMAGHLGSVITRKADFEIMLQNDEATGYTTVTHKPSRVRRFPTFAFTQTKDGYPVLSAGEQVEIEDEYSNNEPTPF